MNDALQAQAAVTSAASGAAGTISWFGLPLDSVGLSAAILFMAFAGSAAGLVVTPPENMPRWRMYALSVAYTLFASALAVFAGKFVPTIADVMPVTALLLAFFAQALVPALRDRLSREVKARQAPSDPGA